MKKITLILFAMFTISGFSQNIVANGDFSNGLTSWSTYLADFAGVSATINASNNEANVVTIAGAGGATWHIQVNQVLTPAQIASLTVGQSYKVTFDARGASARPLKLYFGEDGGLFTALHQQDYNLTATMANYEATFTVGQTFGAMKLGFEGGLSNVDFFIDNVTLQLVPTTPAQLDLLLGFETAESGGVDGGPFGNGPAPVLEAGTGSNTTQVLKIVGNPAGEPWQGINLNLTSPTNLTASQTMTIDVFSADPITFLVKATGGVGGPATVAAQASHPGGSTWQTVSFTFNTSLDGQGALASGTYNKFVIHTYWVAGETSFFPGGNPIPRPARTFYVDNIRGPLGTPPVIPTPATPAPVPTAPNAEVYSIYNDTNSYTTNFPVAYQFGTLSAEPDLDPTSVVNKAYRFNFGIAGWGQGEAMANVSSYGFVSFDYWAQPGLPNGFRFVMISNNGGVTEHVYQIGTNEPLVTGQWKRVEIPMSYFTGIGFASTNFFQWKVSPFLDSVDNAGYVYVDNILLTVNSTLSNNTFTSTSVKMYPNPTNNFVNIDSNESIDSISIVNVLGQSVMNKNVNSTSFTLDISELNAGQYFINLISGNGKVVKKLIKY
jgi:hypothetical protein